MVSEVVMPRLSLTMKEGTIGKWYKKEGDPVEKGEALVEVVSEKATYDVEAPASGILKRVLASEGTTVEVNSRLAVIAAADEMLSEPEFRVEPVEAKKEVSQTIASPAAKRLARENGVELSQIKGSGPEGRINEEDVKKFIDEGKKLGPRIKEILPLSGLKKTSAERVATSFRTAPHSTLVMEIDASRAIELHQKTKLSYTAILIKAVAMALLEHPLANSTLESDEIKIFDDVNIGVATATEHGLSVPVVHNADKKTLQEIDSSVNRFVAEANAGRLKKEDLTGGTFTVTNLGMFGVDFFTPIINPPEAAILGVGALRQRPVVVDGRVDIAPAMTLSLSYDHRILDGAPAAVFLSRIREIVEKGLEL